MNNHVNLQLPITINITDISPSYTGSGDYMVDKKCKSYYIKNNDTLYVESIFLNKAPVLDLLKEYIIDEHNRKQSIDGVKTEVYNNGSNTAAVTLEKGEANG